MDWDRLITIEQMEEATNTLLETGKKVGARYTNNQIGIFVGVFVRFHKFFAVENVYVYKRTALFEMPLNKRKNGINALFVRRNVRVKLNLQRRGVSVSALHRRNSVRLRGRCTVLSEMRIGICAVRNRFAASSAVWSCAHL